MEKTFDRTKLVSSLTKIGHGKLELFEQAAMPAAKDDPDLFAHITAWNQLNGKIRDSKIAYPIIALRGLTKADSEFAENAVACVCALGPRELMRAYQFSHNLTQKGLSIPGGHRRMLEFGIKKYIQVREADKRWWDRAVLQNRKAMMYLYKVSHHTPNKHAQAILFDKKYPAGSVFEIVKNLHIMDAEAAAGYVLKFNIPIEIATGSANKATDPKFIMALIENMTGNELINKTKALKRWGVFSNPVLKASYDAAVERAKKDKKVNLLKAQRAVEAMESDAVDEIVNKKLLSIQQAQTKMLGGIEGDWAVLADRSGSMQESMKLGREIAALLAQQVKGKIYLIFFNVAPAFVDVTGLTLDQINKATRHFNANGGTSIGCGIDYLRDMGTIVNGITIVSDGGDNTTPLFADAYKRYTEKMDIEPTIYFYRLQGEADVLSNLCRKEKIQTEKFDLSEGVDYYSIPSLVKTMRTSRYSLLDEIMNTKLFTFKTIFNKERKKK